MLEVLTRYARPPKPKQNKHYRAGCDAQYLHTHEYCNGIGCKVVTGKTARKRANEVAKRHPDLFDQ